MRAQASMELLVILAALFAFFAAFLPVIREASEFAEFSVAAKMNEAAFNHLTGLAREVFVLGRGNCFSRHVRLAGNGSLWFNDSTSVLWMNFSARRHSMNFSARLGFGLALNSTNFRAGNAELTVENRGTVVEAGVIQERA